MIEYNVNKEKRTVAAFIKFNDEEYCFRNSYWIFDSLYDALTMIEHRDDKYDKRYYKLRKKMTFPRIISAKAKCDPRDEWDEEYGKALARERLVNKIHNYRSNSYKVIGDIVKEIDTSLNK